MDMVKIGQFLSELRKEANLTQAQLGDKLGVTNKTISRWETGTYLPPVEMLQSLSELYKVSINELLSGKKLSGSDWRQEAEENIKSALAESAFSLKERIAFFKKKWKKDHALELALEAVIFAVLLICAFMFSNRLQYAVIGILPVWWLIQYNRMMAYVENRAFGKEGQAKESGAG